MAEGAAEAVRWPGEWGEFQVSCRQLTNCHDNRQEAAAALRQPGRVGGPSPQSTARGLGFRV